jgi:uncharacterized membrane protein
VILQIDFACEESEKEKHHIYSEKELNRQSNNDKQQRTNRNVCQIFSFEEEIFIVFKHRNHVSRN